MPSSASKNSEENFQIFSRERQDCHYTLHSLGQEKSLCFLHAFTTWSCSNTFFEAGISGAICPVSPSVNMQDRSGTKELYFSSVCWMGRKIMRLLHCKSLICLFPPSPPQNRSRGAINYQ